MQFIKIVKFYLHEAGALYHTWAMTAAAPATKQDVEEIVGRVVGEIVGDALQMIAERFDRIEDKMETIASTVDHHTIDIRELRRKTAWIRTVLW